VNPVNPCVSGFFRGELIRPAAIPNGLAGIGFSRWNGPAAQFDKEHWLLIVREATELRDFIIGEMAYRKTIASNGSGAEGERLPSMPNVVQAVSIGTTTILPRLAPRNAGQNKH
jgi:hypothetical protein